MKYLVLAAATALCFASAASAQTAVTTTTTGGAAVTIQPEVRTKVKQYVTTSKPKSVAVPSGFTVRRGVALPETVEIQSLPADVGVTQYRYAVVGDQTVLVDPSSRQIIEVIE